jgi:hypothetical protein
MEYDPGLAAIPPCGDNYSWEQCPHEKGAPLEGAFLFPAYALPNPSTLKAAKPLRPASYWLPRK